MLLTGLLPGLYAATFLIQPRPIGLEMPLLSEGWVSLHKLAIKKPLHSHVYWPIMEEISQLKFLLPSCVKLTTEAIDSNISFLGLLESCSYRRNGLVFIDLPSWSFIRETRPESGSFIQIRCFHTSTAALLILRVKDRTFISFHEFKQVWLPENWESEE